MKNRERHLRGQNIANYLLMVILVLDCFSLYYKTIGYRTFQITCIGLIICLIILEFVNGRGISNSAIFFITYYIFVCTILLFISNYAYLGFFTGCVIPIVMFSIFISMKNDIYYTGKILSAFSNIIFVIACVSLVFYFAGSLYGLIRPTAFFSYSKIGWADFDYESYYGIYFEGQRTFFFGETILRNIGIFLEAPVFSYVLLTALYIEMFMRQKISKKRIIIFVATILSTYSTVGIALCVILIIFFYFKQASKKSFLKLLVPILIVIASYIVISVVGDKVSIDNDSGASRMDDLVACFKCFFDHPLGGVGYNLVRAIDPYRAANRQGGTAGMSAGIPFVLANGGIFYGSIYIVPMVLGLYRLSKRTLNIERAGFIVFQFILLIEIVVEYTLLAQFFLVMSWLWVLSFNDQSDKRLINFRSV